MPVITLKSPQFPGNIVAPPNSREGSYWVTVPGYRIVEVLGVARVTSTLATTFPVRLPPSEDIPYTEGGQITLPTGALVLRSAFSVPEGLTATNGERLKLADAVGSSNTAGTHIASISAVAASGTFAEASFNSTALFGLGLGLAAANTALAADLDLNLFSTNGASAALGTGIMAAGTDKLIPVSVVYVVPEPNGPQLGDAYPQNQGRR